MSVYENIYEKYKNEAKEKVISISNSAQQSSNISNKRKKWKKKKKHHSLQPIDNITKHGCAVQCNV